MSGTEIPGGSSTDEQPDDDEQRPALVARNVHITYRTYLDGGPRLRHRLREGLGGARPPRFKDVHAVRGVDLTLYEGETLGLVGSNGSGKSSLLTGLAGLIELTEGEVLATSRPSLLGVGAALNRRLSGRRNIEIGCLALGLPKAEINDRIDSIIEFTGLEESIDLPMHTYSSGMRARLVFTIATELAPDILLIDEALTVGDRSFKARAAARIEEIRESAGSIIVVSHNLGEISKMCTRVAWLDHGELVMDGDTEEVLEAYRQAFPDDEVQTARAANRKARKRAQGRDKRRGQRRAAYSEAGSDEANP